MLVSSAQPLMPMHGHEGRCAGIDIYHHGHRPPRRSSRRPRCGFVREPLTARALCLQGNQYSGWLWNFAPLTQLEGAGMITACHLAPGCVVCSVIRHMHAHTHA